MPTTNPIADYWLDALQRSVLLLDVLRQRGNIALRAQRENGAQRAALQGRAGARWPHARPAGELRAGAHRAARGGTSRPTESARSSSSIRGPATGPGIGGMKQDSEIGVALAGGPSLLLRRLPAQPDAGPDDRGCLPRRGDVRETVARRHPEAEGKPALIGNCQAGWQLMMMAALQPDLRGPIMLAGSPLSYWAGVRGKNPMRYLGGVLGGTWLTALAGDLGNGIFDGANLVAELRIAEPGEHAIGRSPTTSIPRSIPRPPASWTSRPGGAARCC